VDATLADGSTTIFDYFVGAVQWEGEERELFILAGEGGPLLGMALIHGCDLHIEMVSGGVSRSPHARMWVDRSQGHSSSFRPEMTS
jgi:hypothetical protein